MSTGEPTAASSSSDQRMAEGEVQLANGMLHKAAAAFIRALDLDSEHVRARLGLAQVSITAGKIEQAVILIEDALRLAPDHAEALVLRGLIEEGRTEVDRALDYYTRAARSDPNAYFVRFQRGRALYLAKEYDEAIVELVAAARLSPQTVAPNYVLGFAYRNSGRSRSAVEAFMRCIEIDLTFLDGYVTLADVLCEAQLLDAASKVLLQAQSIHPDAGVVYDKLAAVRMKQGDWPGVVEALKTQTQIDPANEDAHVNLAVVALSSGDAKSAARAVESLLRLHPQSWRGYHLQSMLFDLGDRPGRAIAALREAHRLAPAEWKPLNDLGMLLGAAGKMTAGAAKEAVKVLESAAALAPSGELAPRYNLGLAYWNAGRPRDARRVLVSVAEAAPAGHPVAARAKEAVAAMPGGGR